MTYTTDSRWNDLMTEHELAYFRADVCLGSPQSYSLDEKRQICEKMEASTAEIDAAMRSDFEAMPPAAQARMLDPPSEGRSGSFLLVARDFSR